MNTSQQWTVDACEDANGFSTLRAEVARLRSALGALATVYGPLSSSMQIGSERRLLWDAAFKALERRP